jgi:hypothetical protein
MASYTLQVKAILKSQGCFFERQGKGDHEIWFSPSQRKTLPCRLEYKIAPHGKRVLKQAGLPKAF